MLLVIAPHHHLRACCLALPWCPGALVCVCVLRAVALQIRHVLLSIQALMSTPNPDDPLANDIAEVWKTDQAKALATATEWTAKYATA